MHKSHIFGPKTLVFLLATFLLGNAHAFSQGPSQLQQDAIDKACPKIYKMIKQQDEIDPLFLIRDVNSSGIRTKGLELAFCAQCEQSDHQKIQAGLLDEEKVERLYTQNVPKNGLNPYYSQLGTSFQGSSKNEPTFSDILDLMTYFAVRKCDIQQLDIPRSQARRKLISDYVNYEDKVITPKPEFKGCMQSWMLEYTLTSYDFKKPLRDELIQANSKEEFLNVCDKGFKQSAFTNALQAFLSIGSGQSEYDTFINDAARNRVPSPGGIDTDTSGNQAAPSPRASDR